MFGVDPPWYNDPIERMGFNLYAINIEERKEKIDYAIQLLAQTSNSEDFRTQVSAFEIAGLDISSLTSEEQEYVEKEVTRLCQIITK